MNKKIKATPRVFTLLIVFSFLGVAGCSSDKGTSFIFYGGDILTMNEPAGKSVEAVFVKNGRIISLGSKKDIFEQKESRTKLMDLKGKTLLPGFIAVHTHPDLSAYLHSFIDLSGFTNNTPQAVWEKLATAVKNAPKGEWIFCKGFDPMLVKGLTAPGIRELDAICPENPLVILAQSLHSAWANSQAFQKMGITSNTPDPAPGSFYQKDTQGMLTGFISEVEAIKPFSKAAVKTYITGRR